MHARVHAHVHVYLNTYTIAIIIINASFQEISLMSHRCQATAAASASEAEKAENFIVFAVVTVAWLCVMHVLRLNSNSYSFSSSSFCSYLLINHNHCLLPSKPTYLLSTRRLPPLPQPFSPPISSRFTPLPAAHSLSICLIIFLFFLSLFFGFLLLPSRLLQLFRNFSFSLFSVSFTPLLLFFVKLRSLDDHQNNVNQNCFLKIFRYNMWRILASKTCAVLFECLNRTDNHQFRLSQCEMYQQLQQLLLLLRISDKKVDEQLLKISISNLFTLTFLPLEKYFMFLSFRKKLNWKKSRDL